MHGTADWLRRPSQSRRVNCSFCNLACSKRRCDSKIGGSPHHNPEPLGRNSLHYRAACRSKAPPLSPEHVWRMNMIKNHGCDLNICVCWGPICFCSGGGSCAAGTFNWRRGVSIKSPQCSAAQFSARAVSVGGASASKQFNTITHKLRCDFSLLDAY